MKGGDLVTLILVGVAGYIVYRYVNPPTTSPNSIWNDLLPGLVTQSSDPNSGLPLVTTPYAPVPVVTLTP